MKTGKIFLAAAIVTVIMVLFCFAAAAQDAAEIKEEDAFNAIMAAEDDIQEMSDSGFGVVMPNDLLQQAKEAFAGENYTRLLAESEKISDLKKREQAKKLIEAAQKLGKSGDYPIVMQKTAEIRALKNKAYEVDDLIKALERRIDELNKTLELGDAESKLGEAKGEFYAEAYTNAEDLANGGFLIMDKKASETTELSLLYKAGKENIADFVKMNWKKLLAGFVLALIVGIIIYKQLSIILLRKRYHNLKLERQVLLDLMKKAQDDRFSKGLITNREYEIKTSKFKERLIEVEKEIPVVESKIHLKKEGKKRR